MDGGTEATARCHAEREGWAEEEKRRRRRGGCEQRLRQAWRSMAGRCVWLWSDVA